MSLCSWDQFSREVFQMTLAIDDKWGGFRVQSPFKIWILNLNLKWATLATDQKWISNWLWSLIWQKRKCWIFHFQSRWFEILFSLLLGDQSLFMKRLNYQFFEGLYFIKLCVIFWNQPFKKLANFHNFNPYPPPFGKLNQFLIPPPLRNAEVLNGWSLFSNFGWFILFVK